MRSHHVTDARDHLMAPASSRHGLPSACSPETPVAEALFVAHSC
jgi:hypothetical protein